MNRPLIIQLRKLALGVILMGKVRVKTDHNYVEIMIELVVKNKIKKIMRLYLVKMEV